MVKRICLSVAILCLIVWLSPVYAMPGYSIIDLGSLNAVAINDMGQVAGISEGNACIYEAGMTTNIGSLGNPYTTDVHDINNLGQVVGSSGGRAFLFTEGQIIDISVPSATVDWPNYTGLSNVNISTASAINDKGQIAYTLSFGDFSNVYLWDNGNLTDLGIHLYDSDACFPRAIAINNSGQIVGGGETGVGAWPVFLWDQAEGISYLSEGFNLPTDINNSGQIVGHSATVSSPGPGVPWPAVIYEDGTMTEFQWPGSSYSYAEGINDYGWIVGFASGGGKVDAFLNANGSIVNIDNIIPSNSGWDITKAIGINNVGQIIGSGNVDLNGDGIRDEQHSFLLDPDWDAIVTPENNYLTNITLDSMFTFDYWWEMAQEPDGFNLDILFFRDNSWQLLDGDINRDGSSNAWATRSFAVPEELRGLNTQIRFMVSDLGAFTDPTVYLRNIASNGTAPVPEPATVLLLGSGLLGLVGFRKKLKG